MSALVSREDLIKWPSDWDKNRVSEKPVASAMMNIVQINKLNKLYDKLKDKEGKDFFESYLSELDVKYLVFAEDLAKVPKTGSFILVSNHPLGALDGILMTKIIFGDQTRLQNVWELFAFFQNSDKMSPYVNSCKPILRAAKKLSAASMECGCYETLLEEGGPCFWSVSGREKVSKQKSIRTVCLPWNDDQREKPIKIRIGRPILPKILKEYETPEELGEFLKNKVI
ncbi:hypothetical protein FQR65_LT19568 [Abscondita terminalis]|nr:hypothetical protein FQR65_LT19568 [Abscondita terminalis]